FCRGLTLRPPPHYSLKAIKSSGQHLSPLHDHTAFNHLSAVDPIEDGYVSINHMGLM
ncbi:hypothetical protein PanWU01x14_174940, partial [Parasponia andersonii]